MSFVGQMNSEPGRCETASALSSHPPLTVWLTVTAIFDLMRHRAVEIPKIPVPLRPGALTKERWTTAPLTLTPAESIQRGRIPDLSVRTGLTIATLFIYLFTHSLFLASLGYLWWLSPRSCNFCSDERWSVLRSCYHDNSLENKYWP